jgi:hypothetical protein
LYLFYLGSSTNDNTSKEALVNENKPNNHNGTTNNIGGEVPIVESNLNLVVDENKS